MNSGEVEGGHARVFVCPTLTYLHVLLHATCAGKEAMGHPASTALHPSPCTHRSASTALLACPQHPPPPLARPSGLGLLLEPCFLDALGPPSHASLSPSAQATGICPPVDSSCTCGHTLTSNTFKPCCWPYASSAADAALHTPRVTRKATVLLCPLSADLCRPWASSATSSTPSTTATSTRRCRS